MRASYRTALASSVNKGKAERGVRKIVATEYARLQARATELMGCCEGSDDERELVRTVELIKHLEAGTARREMALRPSGGSTTMAVNKPTRNLPLSKEMAKNLQSFGE